MDRIVAVIPQRDMCEMTDWEATAQSGIWGIMIAAAADRYGGIYFDDRLKAAIQKTADAGLNIGLQVEIRCADPFAANRAAGIAADFCDDCGDFTLPIAAALSEKGSSRLIAQGKDGLTDTVIAFLFETERRGRLAMIKADFKFADTYLDTKRIGNRRLWMDDTNGDDDMLVKKWTRDFSARSISSGDKRYIPAMFEFAQGMIR